MKVLRGTAIAVLLAAPFYLLLIDTVDSPEVYAGLVVVAIAVVAFQAARVQGFQRTSVAPSWLARSWRALARVPVHIWLVSAEALAQLDEHKRTRGRWRAVRFTATGGSPRDCGARALAEAAGSLAPNTIVVGVDRERSLLLVHQLHRQGGREELDVLGLG